MRLDQLRLLFDAGNLMAVDIVPAPLELRRGPAYTDWMKHRVDSQQGKAIYDHRMSVVEPVFGSNKRLNRVSLRTKKKVQGQWQLYCLVHNIEKLANYGQLAA